MGVIRTPNLYKALEFDGESSRTYGVYITGEAVFNAPQRTVDMIEIPGRNGSFALDQGRFENIEVSYPAGIFAESEDDFAEAISDFRNWLCSKNGYCRLTDEYNPNEYRMAIYKSGLEVSPAQLIAGEFNIVFECKPQRFLTSGETKVTLNSGDTITNPTLFNAFPLIETTGYGDINVNSFNIALNNEVLGDITVLENYYGVDRTVEAETTVEKVSETGDTVTVLLQYEGIVSFKDTAVLNSVTIIEQPTRGTIVYEKRDNNIYINYSLLETFPTGSDYSATDSLELAFNRTYNNITATAHLTISPTFNYYTANGKFKFVFPTNLFAQTFISARPNAKITSVSVDSTQSVLGTPTYIDCENGEAYKIVEGSIVGLNRYIDLGSELPSLAPGANTITFDNTFTKIEVIPRWWKV